MIIIFDLDGTILDTYQLIRQNFIDVFETFLPNHKYTEEELQSYFGPPLVDSFMSVVHDRELTEKLIIEYRKFSNINNDKYLALFPNTVEALEALVNKGFKLVIFSNKVHATIELGLRTKNILKYFDYIVGIDDVSKPKPDREGIDIIKKHYNENKCVFIGDTVSDIKTAQNANVPAIGVTWALTKRETFINAKADYIVDDFFQLVKLMEVL